MILYDVILDYTYKERERERYMYTHTYSNIEKVGLLERRRDAPHRAAPDQLEGARARGSEYVM